MRSHSGADDARSQPGAPCAYCGEGVSTHGGYVIPGALGRVACCLLHVVRWLALPPEVRR